MKQAKLTVKWDHVTVWVGASVFGLLLGAGAKSRVGNLQPYMSRSVTPTLETSAPKAMPLVGRASSLSESDGKNAVRFAQLQTSERQRQGQGNGNGQPPKKLARRGQQEGEPYSVAEVERRVRARWAVQNPQEAKQVARAGMYGDVAHVVRRGQWDALRPTHRVMIHNLVRMAQRDEVGVVPCFAPGTDLTTVQTFERVGSELEFFRASSYWSSTAAGAHARGARITLSWSIVPDGTALPSGTSGAGEPSGVSNLKARLNSIYGNEATWRALFRRVFARYSELSGITYVEEPNDDGLTAPITNSSASTGATGVRGDVRIGGHSIDGDSNILAYNYFPNNGDMVIDTSDSFFTDLRSDSLGFRNVVAHEHGHGLAFEHACPIDNTKLMEPFASYAFDGPQIDDIQNAQRGYGDAFEENDSQSGATNLGAIPTGSITLSRNYASLDGSSDLDFYQFSLTGSKRITATVRPKGGSYLEGPQNADGSCTAGTTFNASAQRDLQIAVLDASGNLVGQSNATGAGSNEAVGPTVLSPAAGPFTVRIAGDGADLVQLYDLDLSFESAEPTPDFSPGGIVVVDDSRGNGNSNGKPDPGESQIRLSIPLRNIGDATGTNVTGTLVSLTSGVSVVQRSVTYPDIAAGATASNISQPVIAISSSFSCGATISLRLDLQSAQGPDSIAFTLSTGTLNVTRTTFSYSGASQPIPDGAAPNVAGTPLNIPITVSGSASISDLDFSIDGTSGSPGISHAYVGDLRVTLISPSGTSVPLIVRMVADGAYTYGPNFVQTVLDDEATNSIQSATNDQAPFTGSFKPANALSAFDGQNPNGIWTLRIVDEWNGDTGIFRAASLRIQTSVQQCGTPGTLPTAATTGVIISELRLRGAGSSDDEYVELYNTTNAPINVSNWSVAYPSAGGSEVSTTLLDGTLIPARGHLLLTGSSYSLGTVAGGDVSLTGNIVDTGGVVLRNAAGATIDAAGFSSAASAYREGSGVPSSVVAAGENAFIRNLDNTSPKDTNDNAADFVFVSTNGASYSGLPSPLGAPGPENLSSPVASLGLDFGSIDPSQPNIHLEPNRVRTAADIRPNASFGTLTFRRKITNSTGKTVRRLRLRFGKLTTLNSPIYAGTGTQQADLRFLSSAGTTVNGIAVRGTTLDMAAAQALGGGVNSSATGFTTVELPSGLAPGASENFQFVFGVEKTGGFIANFIIEAITD